jgi:hypothetical protein
MSRYLLNEDSAWDTMLTSDPAFPLVRELSFKYGLKVFNIASEQNAPSNRHFYMSFPNGYPVCRVWAYKDSSGVQFNYRSPYYQKERGRDSVDRETLHSLKLSTLMGTIKKNKVVPTMESATMQVKRMWDSAIGQRLGTLGNDSKDTYGVTPEMAHALIRSYLGESPSTPNYLLDRDICKKLLDKYEQADKIKQEKEELVKSAYHNPFYVVGADSNHDLLVAKVKRVIVDEPNSKRKSVDFEFVQDFKRVKNLEEFPEILPITVMFKASTEGNWRDVFGGFIPRVDSYFADLEVSTISHTYPSPFHFTWMLIPCSQT